MGIYDITIQWTPAMEEALKNMWGINPIKELEAELGKSREQLYKRAAYLNIDGGKDRVWSIDDINHLTESIEKNKGFIPDILREFPEKRISSVYDQIEKFKAINQVINITNKKRSNGWTEAEEGILKEWINKEVLLNAEEKKALLKQLPNRNVRAIACRITQLREDLGKTTRKTFNPKAWAKEEINTVVNWLNQGYDISNPEEKKLLLVSLPNRTERAIELKIHAVRNKLGIGTFWGQSKKKEVIKEVISSVEPVIFESAEVLSKAINKPFNEGYKKIGASACDIVKAVLLEDVEALEKALGELEYYKEKSDLNFSNIYKATHSMVK